MKKPKTVVSLFKHFFNSHRSLSINYIPKFINSHTSSLHSISVTIFEGIKLFSKMHPKLDWLLKKKKTLCITFVSVGLLYLFVSRIHYNIDFEVDMPMNPFRSKAVVQNILTTQNEPRNGKNIFFVDTSEKFHLNARQACAIESAGIVSFICI